jgi:hypothetical protein
MHYNQFVFVLHQASSLTTVNLHFDIEYVSNYYYNWPGSYNWLICLYSSIVSEQYRGSFVYSLQGLCASFECCIHVKAQGIRLHRGFDSHLFYSFRFLPISTFNSIFSYLNCFYSIYFSFIR